MSALLPAGSGSLPVTSHVCKLQPAQRLSRSTSLRLQVQHRISSSSSARVPGNSQTSIPSPCIGHKSCFGSAHTRGVLCRAASQPLPATRRATSAVPTSRGLRRNSSHSRLDSPCRSTLAEPPVVEDLSDRIFEPDIIQDKDFNFYAWQKRFTRLEEVTNLTESLEQSLEEMGALGGSGFTAQDQELLNTQREKHEGEMKLKAQQREQRRLADAARRQAKRGDTNAAASAVQNGSAAASEAPSSASSATLVADIDVSHWSVPEGSTSGASHTAHSTVSLPEAHAPSISLFDSASLLQSQQQPELQQPVISSSGADNEGLFNSAAHTAAARRSSRSSGQRSARLKQNAAVLKAASSGTTKAPKKKPATVVDKSYPLPDNFGQVGSNHKLLSGDEEKRLAYQIQAILPYEEKYEELHTQKLAAAGIETDAANESRPTASHPEADSGKYEPTMREWAAACDRSQDMRAFEREVSLGRKARLQMLECNQRLVRSVARHFKNRGVASEDLIMEGMQGLRRGIDKFDPAKGFKFSTYAHWWIRQAISRCICDQGRVLKVPYHICDLIAKIKKIEREMRVDGKRPQPQQVAQIMGISVNRYHEILAGDASMHSLEQPVGVEKGNKTLEDMLEDTGPSMNELVVHGGLISDVNNLLHTLTPREQGVLRLRYGLDGQGERTLDDIGRFFKVTRERVRQVETKALLKLRQPVRSEALKEYTRANTAQLTWGQCGALGKKSS